jgi:hypothetical protein
MLPIDSRITAQRFAPKYNSWRRSEQVKLARREWISSGVRSCPINRIAASLTTLRRRMNYKPRRQTKRIQRLPRRSYYENSIKSAIRQSGGGRQRLLCYSPNFLPTQPSACLFRMKVKQLSLCILSTLTINVGQPLRLWLPTQLSKSLTGQVSRLRFPTKFRRRQMHRQGWCGFRAVSFLWAARYRPRATALPQR